MTSHFETVSFAPESLKSLCLGVSLRRLVYRDIKQENIGFDVRGDVKVFDFGLAKGLSESLRAKSATDRPVYGYNLTVRSGKRGRVHFVPSRCWSLQIF